MKARNLQLAPVMTRLPIDAKQWLEEQAAKNVTSINAEIVRCIRVRQEAESQAVR
jgi:hypothetical protein